MPSWNPRWYTPLPSSWKGDDMGHDLFFHVLLLLGLFCLCRLLDWVWTWGRPTTGQATPTSSLPFTQRSKAPKPFPGLTHKPRCEACEHAAASRQQVPLALPPRLTCTRGRRSEEHTS